MKFTDWVKFGTNWLLRKTPNSKYWEVAESFNWYINYDKKNESVFIRKWFITDFWSIPRILWIIFDKSKYISYILHDYLYSKKWIIEDIDHYEKHLTIPYTRKQADMILLEALHIEWCWVIERGLIYLWVRIWGWLSFKKK